MSEWVLMYLRQPPQSFQPPLPAIPLSHSTASAASQTKPLQPDLITRYNLKAKLAEEATKKEMGEPEEETTGSKHKQSQAWSQNKGERQALLQKRREEMILAARRKMEARVAAEIEQSKPEP